MIAYIDKKVTRADLEALGVNEMVSFRFITAQVAAAGRATVSDYSKITGRTYATNTSRIEGAKGLNCWQLIITRTS